MSRDSRREQDKWDKLAKAMYKAKIKEEKMASKALKAEKALRESEALDTEEEQHLQWVNRCSRVSKINNAIITELVTEKG